MANEIMTTKELQDINKERQTGETKEKVPPISRFGYGPAAERNIINAQQGAAPMAESYATEAIEEGLGESRYDERNPYYTGQDVETARAIEQSNFWKIGNGVLKGGVTAATTAANTVVGTVVGALEGGIKLAETGNIKEAIDSGVNNHVSQWLTDLENLSEQWFPNYRTAEERSEQYQKEWYKHMGTANFIGDSFLKNFGFTVGAIGGGMIWSSILGRAMASKLASDVMKGAVGASVGDAEATAGMTRALEALKRGTATTADIDIIRKNSEAAAKAIGRMEAQLQLYGSVLGAMGEGTFEGLMAKKEFLESYTADANRRFQRDYDKIEDDVLEDTSGNYFRYVPYIDENGMPAQAKELTEEGEAEVLRRREELGEKYRMLQSRAAEEGEKLAGTTFLLNLPILTASNTLQFGRLFSGGWKTSKNAAASLLRGGIEATKEGVRSNYSVAANKAARTVFRSLKVGTSEASEEMLQGVASSGTKQVASHRLAAYNNDGYDEEAINSYRSWIEQMAEGGKEYLGDITNWQEGALGAITGLLGIPGRRWGGGIIGAYQEVSEEIDTARKRANALNDMVNSDEFQTRWRNYIRGMKYDNEMGKALEDENQYAWHNADQKKLINDIMTFADAGKLNDLDEVVTRFGSISTAEAPSVRDMLAKEDPKSWAVNASDAEVVAKVKEQADKMKEAIKLYKESYDLIAARAPKDASPAFLKELVFTSMELKGFEKRFLDIFGKTMTAIDPILQAMSLTSNEEEKKKAADIQQTEQILRNNYERLFAGSPLPIRMPKVLQDTIDKQLDLLEEISAAYPDKTIHDQIVDMRRLSEDRKDFYKKFVTLQESKDGQKKFEGEAITQADVNTQAENEFAKQETEGLNSLDAVKAAYMRKGKWSEKQEFVKSLETVEESNPAVKQFLSLRRFQDGFRDYLENTDNILSFVNFSSAAGMKALEHIPWLGNSLFEKATTVEEMVAAPDSIFTSKSEFFRRFSDADDAQYEAAKAGVKQAMQRFAELQGMAGGSATLTQTPSNTPETTAATPIGTDAAQPGSVVPEPATEPKPTEQAPTPKPVQEPEPSVKEVDDTDLVDDAFEAEKEQEPEPEGEGGEDDYTGGMVPYLQPAIPETDVKQANAAREAMEKNDKEARMTVDLSDFVKLHPEYETVWNALVERDSFTNTALFLNEGDEIEFVIDPAFPKYKGENQILLATNTPEGRRYLNVLSQQTGTYLNLASLRDAINTEYKEFAEQHPNELFVFSKKSHVWLKRPGLIDYEFSRSDGQPEPAIINIPGYNAGAPIAFIDREGRPIVINGRNPEAVHHVSDTFDDPEYNKESEKRGNLYYLSFDGSNQHYIPIRLGVEHFRQRNMNDDNPVFNRIREHLTTISDIVANSNADNLAEQNRKMHAELEKLVKDLDIHDVYFEIGKKVGDDSYVPFENVGVALRISQEGVEGDHMLRPDQITPARLIEQIASLGKPMQLRRNIQGQVENIKELVDNGLITSNAKMLRPKGVNFYMDTWIPEKKEFGPVTKRQKEAAERRRQTQEENAPTVETTIADIKLGDRGNLAETSSSKQRTTSDTVQTASEEINKKVTEMLNELGVAEDARLNCRNIAVSFVSYGANKYNQIISALTNIGNESISVRQKVNAIKTIINSIGKTEDKRELSTALSSVYGTSADEIDMYQVLLDYNTWKFTGNVPGSNNEEWQMMEGIFSDIDTAISYSDILLAILPSVNTLVGKTDDSFDSVPDFGVVKDLSKFENLPESVRQDLSDTGKTAEKYDKASRAVQDKYLACAGV